MEDMSVRGLVVRVSDYGDYDKLLTLITEEKGRITVTVKGGKSLKNRFASMSEMFVYGLFNVRKTGKYFHLYDGECIEDFYPLRDDLTKLSLASYVCDVATELFPEGLSDPEMLKLTLNTLYAIAYNDTPLEIVKGAFEFKAACLSGYLPELDLCSVCGKDRFDMAYIDTRNGRLLCTSCLQLDGSVNGLDSVSVLLPTPDGVLSALRYISEASVKKFLSFRLNENEIHDFSLTCEKYLTNHLERDFYTLSFYKSITNYNN